MLSTAAFLLHRDLLLRTLSSPREERWALSSASSTREVAESAHMSQTASLPPALRCRSSPLRSDGSTVLLRVLQDAPVSEVVDVTTEEHQLGVSVLGHLAVQRCGVLFRGRNHDGFPAWDPFDSTLCQGTKSATQLEELVRTRFVFHRSHRSVSAEAPTAAARG